MTEKISARFGPYLLLHQLGAGGMGQVFLASQAGEHGIQRLVAIKRILSHQASSKKLRQLFLDEVRIAAQINHGNIVQVVDHGSIDGTYFMAMEYVHGENLADVFERLDEAGQRLPLDILLYVASCVCQGLDHAHGKASIDGRPLEIVHRDISPHNVMLSFQGEVKVADFGVARAAEQTHQTLGGELRGKLNYMSPEQAYGEHLDRRSDLFSLGMVLYEGLTGVNPVAREVPLATLEAVRAVEIEPISAARPDLPRELYELLDSVLAKDPADRPDSARTLYEALQRIMRMHNMVVTSFDLADYLADLFPESGGRGTSEFQDNTAEGRRADDAASASTSTSTSTGGASAEVVRRTLFYQRQRRPDGASLLLAPVRERLQAKTAATVPSRRGAPSWLVALLAALIAGGAVALYAFVGVGGKSGGDAGAAGVLVRRDHGRSVAVASDLGRRVDAAVASRSDIHRRKQRGRLQLRAVPPKVRISIDGRPLGHTPLALSLAPGRYRLRATLPGYAPSARSVRVIDRTLKRVKFALVARPSALELSSSHACALTVDGRAAGRLTKKARRLPREPGRLRLVCRAGDARARQTVRLAAGQTKRWRFGFGVLTVNVQPWARVKVDGKSRGDTPLRLLLAAGHHRLELKNPSAGRSRKRSVDVRAGRTTRVSSW